MTYGQWATPVGTRITKWEDPGVIPWNRRHGNIVISAFVMVCFIFFSVYCNKENIGMM
jgi:hypothetical protein